MSRLVLFLWLFIYMCHVCLAYTHEFRYPVAYCAKSDSLFIVHQQSLDSIELLTKSIKNNGPTSKALSRFFVPAGLKVLPDGSGFSFIHNDTVYLKRFDKRSPKRIEFYEPLYGINTIEWIDAQTFYFFAQEHGRFRIYQANLDGDVQRVIDNDAFDALYPQKIDNNLFYIERDGSTYRILRTSYNFPNEKEALCVFDSTAIAFLHMISDKEGFFLEYPRKIKTEDETIFFKYHQVVADTKSFWESKPLFSFSIPMHYLIATDDDRLYESMLPFLPRYYDGDLYYADCSDLSSLNIFCYEIDHENITRLTTGNHGSYFAPLLLDSQLYLGNIFHG